MKKIELTVDEVRGIKDQLENTLPMAKVKNIVYFLEEKLRKAEEQELGKKEPEKKK